MNLVILPQALRVIIPPLISQYLNLTKNSSLAIAVGYMDVDRPLAASPSTRRGESSRGCCCWVLLPRDIADIISGVMNVYNNSVKLKER
jgi:general L-amino acid transport system permease protein